ncbi:mechanosensitive ion channel family protein [Candidatus Woesearchaeota archaeon]|nr:mechanosensitive ion channel family protein [Candidatus Woesearchaeota archaeon]
MLDNTQANALIVIGVLLATVVIAKGVRLLLTRTFENSTYHINVDHTQFVVFRHMFTPVIYLIGIGIAISFIPPLKAISVSLFASAGVIAVVFGLAAQKAFSNIISGIFLAIAKPFRVGDLIRFGETYGFVEDITLRHTVLKNFNNKRFIIPNGVISDEIIENYHIEDRKVCKFLEIGIGYDSDVDKAMRIMEKEILKHPDYHDIRTPKQVEEGVESVMIRVVDFTDSAVKLRAWVWARDPVQAFYMVCDLRKSIKKQFDKQGIVIPYPQRTVHLKRK